MIPIPTLDATLLLVTSCVDALLNFSQLPMSVKDMTLTYDKLVDMLDGYQATRANSQHQNNAR